MKKGIKFKIFFGISALSFASSFCAKADLPSFEEKKTINEQTVYKEKDNVKNGYPNHFQREKNGLIFIERTIINALSMSIRIMLGYAAGAFIGWLSTYLTDRTSMTLFNFKTTDYLKDFWKDI